MYRVANKEQAFVEIGSFVGNEFFFNILKLH